MSQNATAEAKTMPKDASSSSQEQPFQLRIANKAVEKRPIKTLLDRKLATRGDKFYLKPRLMRDFVAEQLFDLAESLEGDYKSILANQGSYYRWKTSEPYKAHVDKAQGFEPYVDDNNVYHFGVSIEFARALATKEADDAFEAAMEHLLTLAKTTIDSPRR